MVYPRCRKKWGGKAAEY